MEIIEEKTKGEVEFLNKKYWLKDISYESPVIIWDSRKSREPITVNKEIGAYYFGYNSREDFNLFLRKEKEEVEMHIIQGEKCWIRHFDGETYMPCLDTVYLGNLGRMTRFFDESEREYALGRLKELEERLK